MAPARPSSPTSLLWAHQLKREHGYLMKRVQSLESSKAQHEERLKTAEVSTHAITNGEVAKVAKKTLDESGIEGRLAGIEKDVTGKIDDVRAQSEAFTSQITALQRNERMAEEERRQALSKDKVLLRRIGEVEQGLKTYEQTLDLVGRKVNGQQLDLIKRQLEDLTQQVTKEGLQMKLLGESVQKLEQANSDLKRANAELYEKLRRTLAKSPVVLQTSLPMTAPGEEESMLDRGGVITTKRRKLDSDDRSTVSLPGETLAHPPPSVQQPSNATRSSRQTAASTKKAPPPKKPNPVPKAPLTPGERKSHKWSGGGADRDIISAAAPAPTESLTRKRERPTDATNAAPPTKKARVGIEEGGKAMSGRGWYYEMVEEEKAEPDATDVPSKRARRPSEKLIQPAKDEPERKPEVKTRRARLRMPTLRSSEAALVDAEPQVRQTRTQRYSQAKIQTKQDPPKRPGPAAIQSKTKVERRPEPNVVSSPFPSSPPIYQPAVPERENAQIKREPRRMILQSDD